METSFWTERWEQDNTPWHEGRVNVQLERYLDRLDLPPGARVLVPLCGKAEDMWWLLGRGFSVLGIDLSPVAVRGFMHDHALDFDEHQDARFLRLGAEGLGLLAGDFLAIESADLVEVDAVYDRAALVALPAEMRERYVAHLLHAVPASAPILLVSLEYDEAEMDGPPFNVTEAEVRRRFEERRRVEHLGAEQVIDGSGTGLKKRGLSSLIERAYLIEEGGSTLTSGPRSGEPRSEAAP